MKIFNIFCENVIFISIIIFIRVVMRGKYLNTYENLAKSQYNLESWLKMLDEASTAAEGVTTA